MLVELRIKGIKLHINLQRIEHLRDVNFNSTKSKER